MPVTFHTKDSNFNLEQKLRHKQWIRQWLESKSSVCGDISFIFTSNAYLRQINQQYLNHDYFTDVITFDYSEARVIAGDIFISIDEVKINAGRFSTKEEDEIRRVMVHGVIHLMGYTDETDEERDRMRNLENEALHLWLKII